MFSSLVLLLQPLYFPDFLVSLDFLSGPVSGDTSMCLIRCSGFCRALLLGAPCLSLVTKVRVGLLLCYWLPEPMLDYISVELGCVPVATLSWAFPDGVYFNMYVFDVSVVQYNCLK